jgi:CBS domain containing-hemolysin-like protein
VRTRSSIDRSRLVSFRFVSFRSAQWHIALVQQLHNEEDNVDPVFVTVGVITLEDVIEEMLQREIIEEADFFSMFVSILFGDATRIARCFSS